MICVLCLHIFLQRNNAQIILKCLFPVILAYIAPGDSVEHTRNQNSKKVSSHIIFVSLPYCSTVQAWYKYVLLRSMN